MTPSTPPAVTAPMNGADPVAGSPIAHVIVVIQENRTTDNLFASSIIAERRSVSGRERHAGRARRRKTRRAQSGTV